VYAKVDPKVMVPFASAPGRLPRSVVVEKTKKLYQAFNIQTILDEVGIEWQNPKAAPGAWMPLELFDNSDFEDRLPEDWLEIIKQSENKPLKGKMLCSDPDHADQYIWREVKVTGYDPIKKLYEVSYDNTTTTIQKLKLFIESEDPRTFANRFISAYYRRAYADSLIRYNFYIENMPTEEIPELSNEQTSKMINQATNIRSFNKGELVDPKSLVNEINEEFARTMNKIIFDKHMNSTRKELVGGSLMLPPKNKPIRKYYGMINTPEHNFPEIFAAFGFESILTRQEAIKAAEKINLECLEVLQKNVFNINFTKTLKLEEFKHLETSSIAQCSYYLRETWVTKIKDIIKEKFKDSSDWCNLNEKILEIYNRGKLKKFLTLVRIKMQETVQFLFEKSFKSFVDAILHYIPTSCEIISTNQVINTYDSSQRDEFNKPPFPLFWIELAAIGKPEEMPIFSQDPKKLVEIAPWLYDKAIDDMQQISQVEPKIMKEFFKTSLKVDIRVPFRPQKRLLNPTKADKVALLGTKLDPKEMEDNAWMDEYYERLRVELARAVKPLNEYKELYKEFRKEFHLDLEEEKKRLDDPDNPMTSQELKNFINRNEEVIVTLKKSIPRQIQVSIYLVDCANLLDKLVENHTELIQEAKIVLRKRGSRYTQGIIEELEKMREKIKKIPNTIEELTELRNYIAHDLPGLIEKQKSDIEKMDETFDIISEYEERLSYDEFNRKWYAYRMPKELLALVEEQKPLLAKKEEVLYTSMQHLQNEFKEDLFKIEEIVINLKSFTDINHYEEMARKVKTIREKLKEYKEKERDFNNSEMLLNKAVTDYGQLKLIEKDFIPYDNLWTTTKTWYNSKYSWHNDEWEKLNAQNMETTVTDSGRILSQTIRAFKEMPHILKIAEQVKDEVEKFRRYVPLALALRTEGMKDRHWDEISKIVRFDVRPVEGFTMTTVIDKNLIDNLPEIEVVSEKAAKEYAIEMNLVNMKSAWDKVDFKLIGWKNSGTWIVSQVSFEDINSLIDEHMVLTQQMMSSRNFI